ncbi:MAG: outer membrane lipoprotein carrier protein LolA [Bryobacterales bacterium]|nr:outer membrane lipoprotein carrier protein LolA [Acidobacteriota bacterium]MCB9384845.1 outer membrane lipoprotein carrier protein LolA [Bryobacterales bacterium]
MAPAQDMGKVIEGIELHYNRLATLQTEFEQRTEYAGRVRDLQRGTLFLYRPQKMRWEYSKPSGKLLVGDGEQYKMYNKQTNQVRTVTLSDTADVRVPLAFLLGRLSLKRQFKNLRIESVDGRQALIGEGRTGNEGYTRVAFFYDPQQDFRLEQVKVDERNGSTTVFEFSNQIVNVKLDPGMFEFEAPLGAEYLSEQTF